ncbi:hypothetical protein AAFC00_004701 [Neodothiora populina]|uniref:Peptide hydrolase n=1 Tax=Neodothiora populina TaxID=2781224 RepID=A0ABR3P370_9PEZI
MAKYSRNPIAFTPPSVTILSILTYVALFTALIVTHHVVPSAPSNPTPQQWPGVNITQAWHDLEHLSKNHHPFVSKSNQDLRVWLIGRIHGILDTNGADWQIVSGHGDARATKQQSVTLFDDRASNVTYPYSHEWITYFESENVMVYIPGSEDHPMDTWEDGDDTGKGGVLVNAHYDSVSTGYGTTDDGVGVVTVLQLVSHFTTKGNRPKRGIVALLNNGEEDGLHGAKVFTQHPLSAFPSTFLNLEGAGAGGRATLFRSTDAEVTRYYARSSHPFGSVVSGDGFKRGLVRSGTDYTVFTEDLDMRGLDVAFMEPRARYHTEQDDARDTSLASLWHMLSASLATMDGLSNDADSSFGGKGSDGVWFDILGQAFAVLRLHTLFALSVTLLVAGPIFLIAVEVGLRKSDKWYPFSRKQYLRSSDDDEPVHLYGWRGFFRFPLAFIVATAIVIALAYLFTKQNPYIVQSSPYAVWSCMLAGWLSMAWFFTRLGDSVRPSALSRLYTLLWLYILSWAALVLVTVGENQLHLGGGYFMVIYNTAILAALLVSYVELFALPKKSVYAEHAAFGPEPYNTSPRTASFQSAGVLPADEPPRGRELHTPNANENDDATETTSLLNSRQTFTRYGRERRRSEQTDLDAISHQDPLLVQAYGGEQAWSSSLPRWTWFLQMLLLVPINVILVGQIGLLATSALQYTPADGNEPLTIYLLFAVLSTVILLPLTPFMHRMTYHIPTFLFLVCLGTLFYNAFAFPFSRNNRLKVFFFSQIDLDSGNYSTALTGLQPYTSDIVAQLPSANGEAVQCGHVGWATAKPGLESCEWQGLAPNVVPHHYLSGPDAPYPNKTLSWTDGLRKRQPTKPDYSQWLRLNVTKASSPSLSNASSEYVFDIQGLNTRSCRLFLDTPISSVTVEGPGVSSNNQRTNPFVPLKDSAAATDMTQIKLWSRTWDAVWRVRVTLPPASVIHSPLAKESSSSSDVTGKVLCIWADVNQPGTIPAFDEVLHYMPVWSVVTKGTDGLLEGYKTFKLKRKA